MDNSIKLEDILEQAPNWTFQGDFTLLQWMKQIAENLENRANGTTSGLEQLNNKVKNTHLALDNVANSLTTLQFGNQYIESRVHDDDEITANIHENKNAVEVQKSSMDIRTAFLDNNLNMLRKCHEKYSIDLGDSEEEDDQIEKTCIYQPKNHYNDRPLPHIFASKEWHDNWHVGLYNNDDNSGSSHEISDAFSDTASSSSASSSRSLSVNDNESYESNTANISEWASSNSIQNEVINVNVAADRIAASSSSSSTSPFLPIQSVKTKYQDSSESSSLPSSSKKINIPAKVIQKEIMSQNSDLKKLESMPAQLPSTHNEKANLENKNSKYNKPATQPFIDLFAEPPEDMGSSPSISSQHQQIKRKPVNLFDDDDFQSFMTEIVGKAKEKPNQQINSSIVNHSNAVNSGETKEKVNQPITNLFEISKDDNVAAAAVDDDNVSKRDMSKTFINSLNENKPSAAVQSISAIAKANLFKTATPISTRSLFDDDDDEEDDFMSAFIRKSANKTSASENKTRNTIPTSSKDLFKNINEDDDDIMNKSESTSSSSIKIKTSDITIPQAKPKTLLFYDDEDLSSTIVSSNNSSDKLTGSKQKTKNDFLASTKDLFQDDDDDEDFIMNLSKSKKDNSSFQTKAKKDLSFANVDNSSSSSKLTESKPKIKNTNLTPAVKDLFQDNADQQDDDFMINNSKFTSISAAKTSLFDDDDEEDLSSANVNTISDKLNLSNKLSEPNTLNYSNLSPNTKANSVADDIGKTSSTSVLTKIHSEKDSAEQTKIKASTLFDDSNTNEDKSAINKPISEKALASNILSKSSILDQNKSANISDVFGDVDENDDDDWSIATSSVKPDLKTKANMNKESVEIFSDEKENDSAITSVSNKPISEKALSSNILGESSTLEQSKQNKNAKISDMFNDENDDGDDDDWSVATSTIKPDLKKPMLTDKETAETCNEEKSKSAEDVAADCSLPTPSSSENTASESQNLAIEIPKSAEPKSTEPTITEDALGAVSNSTVIPDENSQSQSPSKTVQSVENENSKLTNVKANYDFGTSLFFDEPPDDNDFFNTLNKTNQNASSKFAAIDLENDFYEPALPSIPPTTATTTTTIQQNTEEHSRQTYSSLHLFNDVPPPDDDDDETVDNASKIPSPEKNTRLHGVFYDDFKETLTALNASRAQSISSSSEKSIDDKESMAAKETTVPTKPKSPTLNRRPVSKLIMPNISINVQALLPGTGAKLKKETKDDFVQQLSKSNSAETVTITKTVIKSDNTEKYGTEAAHILPSINKNRVRAPVSRRPSTRKARQESYRKSLLEDQQQENSTENILKTKIEKPLSSLTPNAKQMDIAEKSKNLVGLQDAKPKLVLSSNLEKSIKSDEKPNKEVPKIKTLAKTESKREQLRNSTVAGTAEISSSTQDKQNTVSQIVTVPKSNAITAASDSNQAVNEIARAAGNTALTKRNESSSKSMIATVSSSSSTTKTLSSSKQQTKKTSNLFDDSDSDDDLFGKISTEIKPKATTSIIPKATEKKLIKAATPAAKSKSSLFSDDSEDNEDVDIFKTKKIATKPLHKNKGPATAAAAAAGQSKSLFSDIDSDEDDLFGGSSTSKSSIKESKTKIESKTTQIEKKDSTASHNPLADLF